MSTFKTKEETIRTELLHFTYHVIDKKYEQGSWVSGKINALITINSVLIGALTLLYQDLKEPSELTKLLVGVTYLMLSGSLIFCLYGCIARRQAPKNHGYEGFIEGSLRTTVGSEGLTVANYKSRLFKKNVNDLIELNVDLIQTLNAFITRDQKMLKYGAFFTGSGVLFFMLQAIFMRFPVSDMLPEHQKPLDSPPSLSLPVPNISPEHQKPLCSKSR